MPGAITPAQAANTQAALAADQPPGWWVVRDTNGAIGIQKARPGDNAVKSVFVGTGDTLIDLLTNFSTEVAAAIGAIGGTPSQHASLIAELDSGAAVNGARSWVYVGPGSKVGGAGKNAVSSDAPTKISSEAVGTSVIPGTTGIVNALSNFSPSSILGVLGSLSFWKGIGLVIAGFAILVIAGLELRHL